MQDASQILINGCQLVGNPERLAAFAPPLLQAPLDACHLASSLFRGDMAGQQELLHGVSHGVQLLFDKVRLYPG